MNRFFFSFYSLSRRNPNKRLSFHSSQCERSKNVYSRDATARTFCIDSYVRANKMKPIDFMNLLIIIDSTVLNPTMSGRSLVPVIQFSTHANDGLTVVYHFPHFLHWLTIKLIKFHRRYIWINWMIINGQRSAKQPMKVSVFIERAAIEINLWIWFRSGQC